MTVAVDWSGTCSVELEYPERERLHSPWSSFLHCTVVVVFAASPVLTINKSMFIGDGRVLCISPTGSPEFGWSGKLQTPTVPQRMPIANFPTAITMIPRVVR